MPGTSHHQLPLGHRAAIGFAGLACLCGLVNLLGWTLDSRLLRSFGATALPISPQTAIGYCGLSLGFIFAILENVRMARLLWLIPMTIVVLAIGQNVSGISLGTDLWLFPEGVREVGFAYPGRPGPTTITVFLILLTAGLLVTARRIHDDPVAGLIASGVLCSASASALLILLTYSEDPVARLYTLPIPAILIGLFLLIAFVLWQSEFNWVRLLRPDWPLPRIVQLLLPAALVLPLLPSALETVLSQWDLLSPLRLKLVVLLLNILLVGLVAYYAVRRVAADRSAIVRSMEALQESEQRLATAMSAGQLGVFEWYPGTQSFLWAPGSEERLGLAPGSLSSSEAWQALCDPDDIARVTEDMRACIAAGGTRFNYRLRFNLPNGETGMLDGASRLFYEPNGELTRSVGVFVNVTEREAAQAALRAREAQLSSILKTVPDPMVVLDDQGTIRQFSAAAETLWGYRASEVIGRNFRMLSTAEQFAPNQAKLAEILAAPPGAAVALLAEGGKDKNGRVFPLELRAGVARIGGEVLITIFARDMTERLATEERMSELNRELAHISRLSAMSELAANLAHELNQPLNAGTNFMAAAQQLLKRGAESDRVHDLLTLASEQTLRAGEIIRRLRAFTARGEVDMGIESVEQTVREAVDLVLVGTGQLHIQVDFDFDAAAPMMLADRIQIQQVVVNLVRNAIEALRNIEADARRISIKSRRIEGGMVEITVADTGPGVPDSILDRLFTRFTTTKGENEGMGIGLSISKRIVEAHGGELTAANRREGGAEFRFTLPTAERGEEHV